MAIKINGNNLYRRVWNGQDVQKVVLNGAVIRPYEQPHIDYHVDSSFMGGGATYPGGWSGQGVDKTDSGVSVTPGQPGGTLDYDDERGMPSLYRAKKVEIIVNYARDQTVPVNYNNVLEIALMQSTIPYMFGNINYNNGGWRQQLLQPSVDRSNFSGTSEGTYTSTIVINMEDEENAFITMDTEGPAGFSQGYELIINLSQSDIANIRNCNNLFIALMSGITIKKIDFYVYNNSDVPPVPPTPTPTEWLDEGYHIPTYIELQTLYNALNNILRTDSQTVLDCLHLPDCGMLSNIDGTNIDVGSGIWSSDFYDNRVRSWFFVEDRGITQHTAAVATPIGANIRPFSDSWVEPDNTWTVEYGNLTNGGIFSNDTLGLISIFYGNSRFTMADKNLGATVRWDSGDMVTASNSGYFYQWGNCYGFPITGATTTSGTKPDTTGYGSGTLYTSSTFITTNGTDWMNPLNTTLWS